MQGQKLTDEVFEQIKRGRKEGKSIPQLAAQYNLHVTTVYSRFQRERAKANKAPKIRGGYKVKQAKVATIPLNTAPVNQVDRVVVLLVAPNQLSKVIGELNGRN